MSEEVEPETEAGREEESETQTNESEDLRRSDRKRKQSMIPAEAGRNLRRKSSTGKMISQAALGGQDDPF